MPMKQKPFTALQKKKLQKNGQNPDQDHAPVVKFFLPWKSMTWLISEIDEDGDTMFGLCDLGFGSPELGYVSLKEISSVRGPWGLTLERDIYFHGKQPMSAYAEAAREKGRIVELF